FEIGQLRAPIHFRPSVGPTFGGIHATRPVAASHRSTPFIPSTMVQPPIPDGRSPAIGNPRSIFFRLKSSPSVSGPPKVHGGKRVGVFLICLFLALFLLLNRFQFLFSNYDQFYSSGISLDIFRTQKTKYNMVGPFK